MASLMETIGEKKRMKGGGMNYIMSLSFSLAVSLPFHVSNDSRKYYNSFMFVGRMEERGGE